jgi:hypothetical protein
LEPFDIQVIDLQKKKAVKYRYLTAFIIALGGAGGI